MSPWLKRTLYTFTLPAGLAGACLGATITAAQPGGTGLVGFVLGWFYGVVVRAGIRLFRVPAGAYPLVGFLVGSLPFALLMPTGAPEEARGLVWVGSMAGLVLGIVEWASERRGRSTATAQAVAESPTLPSG